MNDGHGHFDPSAPLPLLPGHSSGGRLERVLRLGRFAVTAELNPPDSADPRDVYERALVLSEVCDAINATDASGANCHMSSVGICSLLTRAGYAVIMQISCRDRNRIAIQGDVLGAAAMGVQNILCLTGDGVQLLRGVADHHGTRRDRRSRPFERERERAPRLDAHEAVDALAEARREGREERSFAEREHLFRVARRHRPYQSVMIALRQQCHRTGAREALVGDAAVRTTKPHRRDQCDLAIVVARSLDACNCRACAIGDHGESCAQHRFRARCGDTCVAERTFDAGRIGAKAGEDVAGRERPIERILERDIGCDVA